MNSINEADSLKSYEPLMHSILKKYKIKRDYEDNLQELRIAALKAIRAYKKSTKPEKKNTKEFTYVYRAVTNRIRNILRIDYRINIEDYPKDPEQFPYFDLDEMTLAEKQKYNMANPESYDDFSIINHDIIAIRSTDSPYIKMQMDCNKAFYKDTLTPLARQVFELKEEGYTINEICKKLKVSVGKIQYMLDKMYADLKRFLTEGRLRRSFNES